MLEGPSVEADIVLEEENDLLRAWLDQIEDQDREILDVFVMPKVAQKGQKPRSLVELLSS